jgi:hypothetical protein
VVALTEHLDRGEHRQDEERGHEDEETEMAAGEPRVAPRHDERDHEGKAHEDRGDNRENDVISVHRARIR